MLFPHHSRFRHVTLLPTSHYSPLTPVFNNSQPPCECDLSHYPFSRSPVARLPHRPALAIWILPLPTLTLYHPSFFFLLALFCSLSHVTEKSNHVADKKWRRSCERGRVRDRRRYLRLHRILSLHLHLLILSSPSLFRLAKPPPRSAPPMSSSTKASCFLSISPRAYQWYARSFSPLPVRRRRPTPIAPPRRETPPGAPLSPTPPSTATSSFSPTAIPPGRAPSLRTRSSERDSAAIRRRTATTTPILICRVRLKRISTSRYRDSPPCSGKNRRRIRSLKLQPDHTSRKLAPLRRKSSGSI